MLKSGKKLFASGFSLLWFVLLFSIHSLSVPFKQMSKIIHIRIYMRTYIYKKRKKKKHKPDFIFYRLDTLTIITTPPTTTEITIFVGRLFADVYFCFLFFLFYKKKNALQCVKLNDRKHLRILMYIVYTYIQIFIICTHFKHQVKYSF